MAIDTLAYTKILEAGGVERRAAEAHAEALVGHVLPDLVGRIDLERAVHQLTVRTFGIVVGVVGLLDGILFALLRVLH